MWSKLPYIIYANRRTVQYNYYTWYRSIFSATIIIIRLLYYDDLTVRLTNTSKFDAIETRDAKKSYLKKKNQWNVRIFFPRYKKKNNNNILVDCVWKIMEIFDMIFLSYYYYTLSVFTIVMFRKSILMRVRSPSLSVLFLFRTKYYYCISDARIKNVRNGNHLQC